MWTTNGDQDLAISQTFGDEVSILQNQGDATFLPNSAWLVSDGPMGLAIVDLDGDETREIVVAAMNNGDISIAYGDHTPAVSRDCNDNGVPDECDWGYYAGDVNCDGVAQSVRHRPVRDGRWPTRLATRPRIRIAN